MQTLRYLLIRGLLQICAGLPLRAVQSLGTGLGALNYLLPTRARNTTLANLELCFPKQSKAERENLARQSLNGTACTALEIGKAWFLPLEQSLALITEIEGQTILDEALSHGKGVIVLTPHLGNWEIFGQNLGHSYPGTHYLFQPPKIERLGADIKAARSRGGLKMVPTNASGVGKLLRKLQQNGIVGILPDQEPPAEAGIFADFFGVPALTMTLASKLVEKTDARVVCGFCQRLPKATGFKIVYKQVDSSVHSSNLQESVQGLNRSVQNCAEQAPEQYQWEYKRFKRRPDGTRFYQ